MKDLNLGSLLVVIPLAHLFLASAFLFAYCAGFGAHVSTFVAVTDVFSTSIREVAPFYIFCALVTFMTFRHELGRWLSSATPSSPTVYGPPRPLNVDTPLLRWVRRIVIAAAFISSATAYLTGHAVDVTLVMVSLAMTVVFSNRMFRFRPHALGTAIIIGSMFLVSAFAAGLNAGQEDRHSSYAFQVRRHAGCGEFVAMRRFSDLYLAIGPDDRHHLIDQSCEAKFDLPPVKSAIKKEQIQPRFRWVFGW